MTIFDNSIRMHLADIARDLNNQLDNTNLPQRIDRRFGLSSLQSAFSDKMIVDDKEESPIR